jgi:hypothetical protein
MKNLVHIRIGLMNPRHQERPDANNMTTLLLAQITAKELIYREEIAKAHPEKVVHMFNRTI